MSEKILNIDNKGPKKFEIMCKSLKSDSRLDLGVNPEELAIEILGTIQLLDTHDTLCDRTTCLRYLMQELAESSKNKSRKAGLLIPTIRTVDKSARWAGTIYDILVKLSKSTEKKLLTKTEIQGIIALRQKLVEYKLLLDYELSLDEDLSCRDYFKDIYSDFLELLESQKSA